MMDVLTFFTPKQTWDVRYSGRKKAPSQGKCNGAVLGFRLVQAVYLYWNLSFTGRMPKPMFCRAVPL